MKHIIFILALCCTLSHPADQSMQDAGAGAPPFFAATWMGFAAAAADEVPGNAPAAPIPPPPGVATHEHPGAGDPEAHPFGWYDPAPWEDQRRPLTLAEIMDTLQAISEELRDALGHIVKHRDKLPEDKYLEIERYLSKWIRDAGRYYAQIHQKLKVESAAKFCKRYKRSETKIGQRIGQLESIAAGAQPPEEDLADLLAALSLDGAVDLDAAEDDLSKGIGDLDLGD